MLANLPTIIIRFTVFYFVVHFCHKAMSPFMTGYVLTFSVMFAANLVLVLMSLLRINQLDRLFTWKFWSGMGQQLVQVVVLSLLFCFLVHFYGKLPF